MVEECTLCNKEIKAEARTNCRHYFCYACLVTWLVTSSVCPTCSGRVNEIQYNIISETLYAAIEFFEIFVKAISPSDFVKNVHSASLSESNHTEHTESDGVIPRRKTRRRRRRRRRHVYELVNHPRKCFICKRKIKTPASTDCLHFFCYDCISRRLDVNNSCLVCSKRVHEIYYNIIFKNKYDSIEILDPNKKINFSESDYSDLTGITWDDGASRRRPAVLKTSHLQKLREFHSTVNVNSSLMYSQANHSRRRVRISILETLPKGCFVILKQLPTDDKNSSSIHPSDNYERAIPNIPLRRKEIIRGTPFKRTEIVRLFNLYNLQLERCVPSSEYIAEIEISILRENSDILLPILTEETLKYLSSLHKLVVREDLRRERRKKRKKCGKREKWRRRLERARREVRRARRRTNVNRRVNVTSEVEINIPILEDEMHIPHLKHGNDVGVKLLSRSLLTSISKLNEEIKKNSTLTKISLSLGRRVF